MDINLNTHANTVSANWGTTNAGVESLNQQNISSRDSNLKIVDKALDLGIEGAGKVAIEESTLSREDALGKLVNSAFSFPPPPMPAFE